MNNPPRHIFIMPDGNRRWAEKRGKSTAFGHRAGAKNAERIFKLAQKAGVECLTIWGCSVKNLIERQPAEVRSLYAVFEYFFRRLLSRPEYFRENKLRVEILGRWEEFFPPRLAKVAKKLIKDTAKFGDQRLVFLMAYSGIEEVVGAARKIVRSKARPEEVDRQLIKDNLWSHDLPPVDLVIRTGGEPHWSEGAMMWDVADAQLYFTETFWPDFGPEEFERALQKYATTKRRFGK